MLGCRFALRGHLATCARAQNIPVMRSGFAIFRERLAEACRDKDMLLFAKIIQAAILGAVFGLRNEAMAQHVDRQTGFAQDNFPLACADLCCCVEAGRQACALLAQTADAITSGTEEVQAKLLQNTGEHVEIGFRFAERIIVARCLEELLYVQHEFARHVTYSYARQVRDLLRLIILFAPRDRDWEY